MIFFLYIVVVPTADSREGNIIKHHPNNVFPIFSLLIIWALKQMFFIRNRTWCFLANSTFVGLVNTNFFQMCCQANMNVSSLKLVTAYFLSFCLSLFPHSVNNSPFLCGRLVSGFLFKGMIYFFGVGVFSNETTCTDVSLDLHFSSFFVTPSHFIVFNSNMRGHPAVSGKLAGVSECVLCC